MSEMTTKPTQDRLRRRIRKGVTRLAGQAIDRALSPTYRHHCPVCDRRVRAFEPVDRALVDALETNGWKYGLDAFETLSVEEYACPYCRSTDRDRMYAHYLSERSTHLAGSDPVRVLDIAPTIPLGTFLDRQPRVRRRTADLFMTTVDDVVDIQRMDVYTDGRFDGFVCSHVLEHVPDDRAAMAELFRVLRPGGWGIAMVPICLTIDEVHDDPSITGESERWRHYAQGDHVRLYSKQGWIARLEAAGFVVHQYGIGFFGEDVFRRLGLTPTSVLYVCEKPGSEPAASDLDRRALAALGRD